MGLGHYLFSFSGRANRARQWALILVGILFGIITGTAFGIMVGWGSLLALFQGKISGTQFAAMPQLATFGIVACALYLLNLWIVVAVTTKRLHDRNKSAWWLLVFFVLPFVLNIPAILTMPAQFAHLGDVFRAAQQNLPPPPPPIEPPLVLIARAVASLISLWAFVELYFFRGTAGDNRYGPDPLAD
ncbi:MAG: DUF805 domain-containing protein [Proteobacteria bacterium]|nr:DUF805 domain-containing protein [Pseudomonadota bacterium]